MKVVSNAFKTQSDSEDLEYLDDEIQSGSEQDEEVVDEEEAHSDDDSVAGKKSQQLFFDQKSQYHPRC